MLNFLTKKQRERVYKALLANLSQGVLEQSGFEINEECVRVSFNPAYSDHRVVSIHSLPELSLFAPVWDKVRQYETYPKRGASWFVEKDETDPYSTEHKKIILEFCLVIIDDVEKQMKQQIKIYKKQLKKSHRLMIPRYLGKYKEPKFIEFQI